MTLRNGSSLVCFIPMLALTKSGSFMSDTPTEGDDLSDSGEMLRGRNPLLLHTDCTSNQSYGCLSTFMSITAAAISSGQFYIF